MFQFLWNFIAFVIALSILISMHELGHFCTARFFGVKIERFSIGFGYIIWKGFDQSGTEYVISSIPLGGYVKMLDERISPVLTEYRHQTFNYKKIWQRIIIIISGPIFNFLLAFFIYWLIFLHGVSSYRPIVGNVIQHSIAEQAGISPNVELKSIDGVNIPDWNTLRLQLMTKIGCNETTINVSPLKSNNNEIKKLNLKNWKFDQNQQDIILSLGIVPINPYVIIPVIDQIKSNSLAMKAGFQINDQILEVNNHSIDTWNSFIDQIYNNSHQLLKVKILRNKHITDILLKLDHNIIYHHQFEKYLGIIPKIISLSNEYKITYRYNIYSSFIQAGYKTIQLIHITISTLKKLITGYIHWGNLGGPISIAQGAGISAEYGIICYFTFLALISINLGVINLFPLPILDGGHIFFLIIEKINGKPISKRIENLSYQIGYILLILLMSISIFNDLKRFFLCIK